MADDSFFGQQSFKILSRPDHTLAAGSINRSFSNRSFSSRSFGNQLARPGAGPRTSCVTKKNANTPHPWLRWVLGFLATTGSIAASAAADRLNGFDLGGALVPVQAIHQGGPPKDGIPAIDNPRFVAAGHTTLDADDRVLGVVRNGVAKAYPVRILNWHEVVNDRFGADGVAVTYCPLCRSGVAFLARAKGQQATFGVSGLLYDNNVLLYDRETQSLWSQMRHQAVTGPMKGERLEQLPMTHATWGWWRARHPDTLVLSFDTGVTRDYATDPYGDYERVPKLHFPISAVSDRLGVKDVVVGVAIDNRYKAYPLEALRKAKTAVNDTLAGRRITLHHDAASGATVVTDTTGNEIPSLVAYWFAWYAFHPDTEIFAAQEMDAP